LSSAIVYTKFIIRKSIFSKKINYKFVLVFYLLPVSFFDLFVVGSVYAHMFISGKEIQYIRTFVS